MHRFRLPYHLIVKEGIFSDIPGAMSDVFPRLKKQKTILVTEENLKGIFQGIINEILHDFPGCELYLITEASYDAAVALAKRIAIQGISTVIGFGGGTVLDLAKYAAFVAKAQLVSLPTTLSNDSLASPVAVLGMEGKARRSLKCTIPDAILVDASVIKSAPERQLLAGIGDTVSKYTALYDWRLAARKDGEPFDDFAYMISRMALDSIVLGGGELKSTEFIERLTHALVMGGLAMEIAGSSRPSSGSEHLFCHALEENYGEINVPHGIAVAMGSYCAVKFQGQDEDTVKELIRRYRIPVKPSAYGVTEEIFVGAWQNASASRPDRYSILNETELDGERLRALYAEMESEF